MRIKAINNWPLTQLLRKMGDRSAVDAAIVQSEKQEIQQRPMEAPERSKVFQEPSYKRGAVPPNLVITDIDEDKDADDSKTPISVRVENGSNFFYNPR